MKLLALRYAVSFLAVHWILYLFGVYWRGHVGYLFGHFIYEPILLMLLFVLDLPAIFVAEYVLFPLFGVGVLINSGQDTSVETTIFVICMSLQWLLIGYLVGLGRLDEKATPEMAK
jgi:hypothetical protein